MVEQYRTDGKRLPSPNIPGPRMVGVDLPSTPGSAINPGGFGAPNTQGLQYLEQGGQYLAGAAEYEQKSNQQRQASVKSAQDAVGQTISSAAQMALDMAKAKSVGKNNGGFETLVGAVGEYFKIQKAKENAEQVARQKQEYLGAFQEVQDLKVKWRESGLDKEGVTAYTSTLKSALGKYKMLDAEQIQKLTDDGYSIAVQYATEKSHAQQAYFKDLREKAADTASAGLMLQLNGNLSKLQTDIYSDTGPIMEAINTQIGEYLDTPGMDTLTKAVALNTALKATLSSMDKHNDAYNQLAQQIGAIDQYAGYSIKLTQEIESGARSPQEVSAMLQRERLRLGVPGNYNDPDAFESEKLTQQHLETREGIRSLREKDAIREAERAQMDSGSISYLAWGIINNPKTLAMIKANKQYAAVPGVQTAIALADDYMNGEKDRNKLILDMQSVREQLAQAQKGDTNWFISQVNSGGNQSINEILQIQLGIQLPKSEGGKLTPEQAEQYQAASKAYQDELINRFNILQTQYVQKSSTLQNYGLVGDRMAIDTRMKVYKTKYDSFVNTFGSGATVEQGGSSKGASSPFSQSALPKARKPATFATMNYNGKKTILPFAPNAQVTSLNNYKQQREKHVHAGEDLPVPEGTKIQTPARGKVVRVQDDGDKGYGQFVDVLGEDGKLYRYAHLTRKGVYVQAGQTVEPGEVLAKSGNTGGSEGPHLHFEIRDPNKPYGFDGTVDPLNYLASVGTRHTQASKPRTNADGTWFLPSLNSPSAKALNHARIPANAIALPGGQYILNNQLHKMQNLAGSVPVTKAYSTANPLRNGAASTNKNDYGKNKPGDNYGYGVIAGDRQFSSKLANVSDRLGIPAQWLSDVMAFETGGTFDPGKTNELGCTGLIQFCPEGGQAELRVNSAMLSSMSRSQQLEYVHRYLAKFGSDIQRGPEWLLASIWGGQGLLNAMKKRGVAAVASDPAWNDGNITFGSYLKRLGEHAGRQYGGGSSRASRISNRIHTHNVDGCKMCVALQASNSAFIPHEQPQS